MASPGIVRSATESFGLDSNQVVHLGASLEIQDAPAADPSSLLRDGGQGHETDKDHDAKENAQAPQGPPDAHQANGLIEGLQ